VQGAVRGGGERKDGFQSVPRDVDVAEIRQAGEVGGVRVQIPRLADEAAEAGGGEVEGLVGRAVLAVEPEGVGEGVCEVPPREGGGRERSVRWAVRVAAAAVLEAVAERCVGGLVLQEVEVLRGGLERLFGNHVADVVVELRVGAVEGAVTDVVDGADDWGWAVRKWSEGFEWKGRSGLGRVKRIAYSLWDPL